MQLSLPMRAMMDLSICSGSVVGDPYKVYIRWGFLFAGRGAGWRMAGSFRGDGGFPRGMRGLVLTRKFTFDDVQQSCLPTCGHRNISCDEKLRAESQSRDLDIVGVA